MKRTIYEDEWWPVYGLAADTDPSRCVDVPDELVAEIKRADAAMDEAQRKLRALFRHQEASRPTKVVPA